jgi:hypothetical protein
MKFTFVNDTPEGLLRAPLKRDFTLEDSPARLHCLSGIKTSAVRLWLIVADQLPGLVDIRQTLMPEIRVIQC